MTIFFTKTLDNVVALRKESVDRNNGATDAREAMRSRSPQGERG